MNDEQVERVARAMFRATNMNEPATWDEEGESYYTHLARAAIAAMHDEPPLENVLREGRWTLDEVGGPHVDTDDFWATVYGWDENGAYREEEGTGPTIAAAIRAAIEHAKGQGDE